MTRIILIVFLVALASPVIATDKEAGDEEGNYLKAQINKYVEISRVFKSIPQILQDTNSDDEKIKAIDKFYSLTDKLLLIALETRNHCETLEGPIRYFFLEKCQKLGKDFTNGSAKYKLLLAETCYSLNFKDKGKKYYEDIIANYYEESYRLHAKKAELALKDIEEKIEKEKLEKERQEQERAAQQAEDEKKVQQGKKRSKKQ